jgi:serine/threonine-protein kinase HipA
MVDAVLHRPEVLRPVTNAEIGSRLSAMMAVPDANPLLDDEHYSVAGYQPKMALRRTSDGWAEALEAAATTHILKPGIPRLEGESLNEQVCMAAARSLGLDVAESTYETFAGTSAIVVSRYDRVFHGDDVIRVHQEDLCQALRLWSRDKYPGKNGPTAVGLLDVVRRNAGPEEAQRFFDYLLYNYLIGAPDTHAKNFSLLLLPGLIKLAPLYDVASGLPYSRDGQTLRFSKFALPIDRESQFGKITSAHWTALAKSAKLDPETCLDHLHDLATRIPGAFEDIFSGLRGTDHLEAIRTELMPRVASLCGMALGVASTPSFAASAPDLVSNDLTFDAASHAEPAVGKDDVDPRLGSIPDQLRATIATIEQSTQAFSRNEPTLRNPTSGTHPSRHPSVSP